MPTAMPDVANQSCATTEGTLDWVGMSHIEVPLMLALHGEAPRQASALRGGRSGPSVTNDCTPTASAAGVVFTRSGSPTEAKLSGIANIEQQDAQALQLNVPG